VDQSLPDYQVFLDSVNDSTCAVLYSSATTKQELYRMIREKTESVERFAFAFMEDGILCGAPMVHSKELLMSLVRDYHATHMDFLACYTLEDPLYKELYASLEKIVVVGASSDRTGNLKYGGNWTMENTKEDIEQIYFTKAIENYNHLLDSGECFLYVKNGLLYALGLNTLGQAGMATPVRIYTPTPVTFVDASGISLVSKIKHISFSYYTTFILLTDGTLWASGYNFSGQLGLGDNVIRNLFTKVDISDVAQISVAVNNTYLVKKDGTLWGTGNNIYGQLGLGDNVYRNIFTKVDISDVAQVSSASFSPYIRKNDGTVWSCGQMGTSALGKDGYIGRYTQVNISDVVKVEANVNGVSFLKKDGTLWASGINIDGNFGKNSIPLNITNDLIVQSTISGVEDIVAGRSHLMARKNGTWWGIGTNTNGQLGLGDLSNRSTYVNTGQTAQKIILGRRCTFIIKDDYSLWGAGDSSNGLLGTTGNKTTFYQVDTGITCRFPSRMTFSIQPALMNRSLSFQKPTSTGNGLFSYTPLRNTIVQDASGGILNITKGGKEVIKVQQSMTDLYDESFLLYEFDTNYLFTPTSLSNFNIPNILSRRIKLSPPQSNRDGTFTYTSNNPYVATILGDVLYVHSLGNVTVTAYQEGTEVYGSKSIDSTFDTTPIIENEYYNTFVTSNNTSFTIPTDSTYIVRKYSSNIFLSTPFVFIGKETTTMTVYTNGYMEFQSIYTNNDYSFFSYINFMNGLNIGPDDFYSYKEESDRFTLFIKSTNPTTSTTGSIEIKVTLFLKSSERSGDVLIEYGNLSISSNTGDLYKFGLYNHLYSKTIENEDWFLSNLKHSMNTEFYKEYTATQSNLTSISNKSVLLSPSVRSSTYPVLQSWSIPNNSNSRRIRLTQPESSNTQSFTYSSSNESVASIEGNDVVLHTKNPVTITATQSATSTYNAASVSVLMDSSYFTQIIDFPLVPTIQPWSIPNNSPSRVIRLTRPVSDSPAPFTYTTSDPSIATIEEGTYLLAYKAGTVTITATQPAIQGTNNYYEAATTSVTLTPSYFTFMTDICFLAGTPILTDQGTFPIETLTNQTLDGKPILRITKTLGTEEQMVCFEKDSLGKDQPSQKTVMTMKHRLEKDGKRVKASECVNGESIHTEWYMGEYLYNVLLAEQSLMNVNGLWCETLDPENDVAKFYLA